MTQAIVPKELLTATPGGLSLLVVSGGADGQVLTQQADGTYAPEVISAGDVVGPSSSTDNAVARFDTTTGKLLQNAVVTIGDTGNIAGLGTVACGAITTTATVTVIPSDNATATGISFRTMADAANAGITNVPNTGELRLYSTVRINLFDTMYVNAMNGIFGLGGLTNAHVGLKRSGTTCQVRLGDDSADAPLTASAITASDAVKTGLKLFAALPAASASTDCIFTVTDRSGRPLAKSDGTNWYNVFTGAVLT